MLNDLIKELKNLAEKILEEDSALTLESRLVQSRELYEKLMVLHYLNEQETNKKEPFVQEKPEEPFLERDTGIKELFEIDSKVQEKIKEIEEPEEEEDQPLSLNDLFVPTFDGIKEDMSQKEEFKDTVSLDETENLFQIKKEAPKQLSLNDKLLGNSIQVGLNDRIAFVNKLFNFSQSDFNKVLSKLNECVTKEEALHYFQYQVKPNYNWKGKEDLEDRFVSLVERKFL
jgi:hypothetical protein